MKKMIMGITVLLVMVASVTTFATAVNDVSAGQEYISVASQLHMQGAHCNGILGCDCRGFAPITNGAVWQQAYCRYCGHKKTSHK